MLLILRAEEESEQKTYSLSSRLEFWKTMVDYYKHLMTLSMASIAAFGGVLGIVFRQAATQPSEQQTIWAIFGCFFGVLVLSFVGMRLYGQRILSIRDVALADAEGMKTHFEDLRWKALLGFLGVAVMVIYCVAILLFFLFVVHNLQ